MNREQILAMLYEMAMVIGGEVKLQPLLTKTLQRLLFHTSFPCGMIFFDSPELSFKMLPPGSMSARLELSIGDYELTRSNGKAIEVPAALLRGPAELRVNPDLLNKLPCRKDFYTTFLRLPVYGNGIIVLLAPEMPSSDTPFTQIFQPVLGNLAKAILLCRSNEAHTQRILEHQKTAEYALQDLSYRNRLILDSLGEGICGVDRYGKATFINPAAARMLGFEPEELIGRSLHGIVHHEKTDGSAIPEDQCPIMLTIRDGNQHRIVADRFHRKDGTCFPVEYVSSPLREGDRVVGAVVVFQDITERTRAEEEIRQLASIVESSNDAIIGKSPDGTVLSWNSGAQKIFGYSAAEMKGRRVTTLVPPGFPDDVGWILGKINQGEHVEHYETLRLRKDGKKIPVSLTVSPVRDASGGIVGASTIARDITDRKEAEEQLRKNNGDLQKLNRALLTLSSSNMILIHAREEQKLLQDICKTVVTVGAYQMVWVGFAEDDEQKTIRPVASAGFLEGYLDALPLTYDGTCGCPAGAAIQGGKPFIVQDIAGSPGNTLWHSEALKRQYASCIALPLMFNHRATGALSIYSAEQNAFTEDEVQLLTELAGDLSFGIMTLRTRSERDRAVEERQLYFDKLRKSMEGTIQAIGTIVEMRDPYISGHQRRVAKLAVSIAKELGLPPDKIEGIHFGSLIHDIGKIYIPAEFLSRPGKLADLEYRFMKTHPEAGYEIMKDVEFPWPIAEMIRQHHEHLDGSGYPHGLKGDDILLEARIIEVADIVEAMASHRPYRPAWGIDIALGEVVESRGVRYDAGVVDACIRLFKEKGYAFA